MTELFEVITKEEFVEDSGAVVWSDHDSSMASSVGNDEATAPDTTNLTYCEFCKDYYNEYHFGDIDEPSR